MQGCRPDLPEVDTLAHEQLLQM